MKYQNEYGYPTNDRMYTEGIIDDALKSTANVDVDKVKEEWNNAADSDDPNYNKLDSFNKNALDKAQKSLGSIDKTLSKNRVDTRSIITRARNSVLQFPVYVTQTLRVNEAQIIAKMFEKVYTTFVQTVLSQNQLLDEEEANNLVFLKSFHTNLKEAADVLINEYYKPIDEMDQMMQDSIFYSERLTENCSVEFKVVPSTNKDLILENARLIHEPLAGFIYLSEADKTETKEMTNKYSTVSTKELEEMAKEKAKLSNIEWKLIEMSNQEIEDETMKSLGKTKSDDQVKEAVKRKIEQKSVANDKYKKALDDLKDDIKNGKVNNYSYDGVRYRRVDNTTKNSTVTRTSDSKEIEKAVDVPKLLRDTDIKKINSIEPYMVEVTFRIRTKQGIDRDIKYIIGIKTVMHLIRTQDLVDDLEELITGNIKSLQKVRYKTGEINFMDYMFNFKALKSDAAKHINYNKRWINTLKRLADYRKMNGAVMKKPVEVLNKGDVPIPNGTLILAQPDITMLTNQTGLDLSKVSNAKRLARNLFLIAIVIVDSSAGTMRVLFPDSNNDWDVHSLAAIDAEVSKTDNSKLMKELNRMVNR